jgi:site-specific DNA-cytosine methylase
MPIYFPARGEEPPSVHSPVMKINHLYGKGNLRKVSVAEAMLLQGFPKSFVSHENRQLAYQHAGNAVNAKVVRELAFMLLNFIEKS